MSRVKHGVTVKCANSKCRTEFRYYKHKCFFDEHEYQNIPASIIMHPLDKHATEALRKVPGFDYALKKMMTFGYEKYLRVMAMADDVKVTPNTCGYIYDMVSQASKCLGIPVPDVFINQNPIPNAWTFGSEYPIITIRSGLIELLDDDELYAVIAHEVTHIKCEHVLYHMLANFIINLSEVLGAIANIIVPLRIAILEWARKSELSADRGALVVTNNKKAVIKMLMKIAGGSGQVADLINEKEFVAQAKQFEKMTSGFSLNKVYRIASNVLRDHPFPVLRASEINKWADGDEYRSIYEKKFSINENDYDDSSEKCPHCGAKVDNTSVYCRACGQTVVRFDAHSFVGAANSSSSVTNVAKGILGRFFHGGG